MGGIFIATIVVGLAIIYVFLQNRRAKRRKLPPGPPGLPIVGHLPLLGKNPCKKFLEWKNIYGPIFSIKLASYPAVVINDVKLIKEAWNMEAFSGRPTIKLLTRIFESKGINFTDGPRQLEQRRFATKTLKQFGAGKSSMEYRLQEEITKFVNILKQKCKADAGKTNIEIKMFFKFPVVNSVWDIITGQRFDENDPTLGRFLESFDKFLHSGSSVVAQLTWFFPWVATIFSFFGYDPLVKEMRSVFKYFEEQIEVQKTNYAPGEPKHYTHAYFDQVAHATDLQSCFHKSRNEQARATCDIFGGASDTVTVTMDWLLLYMAREPSIQQKLQQEIDLVFGAPGGQNIPSLADRNRMPYTEAVIQEILRISTILPMAVYHRTLEDIPDFHGYGIPKDTIILPNIWAIHHDPDIWPQPDKFNPERFLDVIDGTYCKKKSPSDVLAFSFGKRSCIGEGIARDELFLFTTRFFQTFSIACMAQKPSLEGSVGMLVSPKPFQVILTER